MMPSRSNVRTNVVIVSILGLVVALLIHFIVLSSPRYNWLEATPEVMSPEALMGHLTVAAAYLGALV